jgi:hypothetical protein
VCCYPLVGIVALRRGKCVATGNEAARYCDDPRPTRRGLADPEKSVVTKAKIGHFVTPPADILASVVVPAAVSAANPIALSISPRENVGKVQIKTSENIRSQRRIRASPPCGGAPVQFR